MLTKRKNALKYTTYKRFIFSFLFILFLPIISFTYLFIYDFRDIYSDNIVEQAEKTLEVTGQTLGQNLNNLESLAVYNSTNERITKKHLIDDYRAEEVRRVLSTCIAANEMIRSTSYYNSAVPGTVYTESGTYSVDYYARLCVNDISSETFLREILEIDGGSKWLLWENEQEENVSDKRTVQYVVKSGADARWIFMLSGDALKKCIYAEDAATVLLDPSGRVLCKAGSIDAEQSYLICYTDPSGKFQLNRYIDREVLFEELEKWQGIFSVVVIMVALLGGVLVLVLTRYNGQPFVEFLDYCKQKIKNIPENLNDIESFYFAINVMEKQIYQEEQRFRINSVLLHLLYSEAEDTKDGIEEIREARLFERAIAFRVVLINGLGKEGLDLQMLHLYMEALNKYEYYLLDFSTINAMVMIVGMLTEEEDNLEVLTDVANEFQEEIGTEIRFYVGDKCEDMSKLHVSYAQAISCRQTNCEDTGKYVYYYRSEEECDIEEKNQEDVLKTIDVSGDTDEIIPKVQAFIEENSKSIELNVNMVANHFGISVSLLSQKFKKQMDINISDYINELKFTYACELLMETDHTVNEITEMIGYSHPVSFIRRFKQLYGMTPAKYRESGGKIIL